MCRHAESRLAAQSVREILVSPAAIEVNAFKPGRCRYNEKSIPHC